LCCLLVICFFYIHICLFICWLNYKNHFINEGCWDEINLGIVLDEGLLTQADIPLTHKPAWHVCKELLGSKTLSWLAQCHCGSFQDLSVTIKRECPVMCKSSCVTLWPALFWVMYCAVCVCVCVCARARACARASVCMC
jgi:hypothetical protein